MGFLSFGKRPKHRSFDYIPRYYDPEKEEMQQRLKRYKQTESQANVGDAELAKQRIRGGFRRNSRASSEATKIANRRSNLRLLMIIAILLLVTFYFINNYLPKIVAAIESPGVSQ